MPQRHGGANARALIEPGKREPPAQAFDAMAHAMQTHALEDVTIVVAGNAPAIVLDLQFKIVLTAGQGDGDRGCPGVAIDIDQGFLGDAQ